MRRYFLLLTAGLSLQAFAQTDSAGTSPRSATYTSLASLTRTDIERLPATNFMTLVQGAFPFIGNVSEVEEEYTVVMDGFVAVNPNAINLSQIESIRFYPAGTTLTRGSLGKKGTFVVRMQPVKSGFDFSTKTGLLRAEDSRTPAGATLRYEKGFASLNELSFRRKSERAFFSSALSYLRNNSPDLTVLRTSGSITSHVSGSRIRLSNAAGLQWNRRWSLEGGLFLTTQPQQTDLHEEYLPGNSLRDQRTDRKTLYASAHAGLLFSPTEKFRNRLVAEMSYAENKTDNRVNSVSTVHFRSTSATDQFQRYYAFTNHLTWRPVSTSGISLEASLVARYRFSRGSEDNLTTSTTSTGYYSQNGSFGAVRSRSFAVSPSLVLQLRQLLTAEVGATYDDYGYSAKGNDTYKKLLPYGGLRLDLLSLLKGSGISTLELSSTFQKYQTSYDQMDLLGTRYRSNLPASNPVGAVAFPNPEASRYSPSKVWVSSLAVGWWKKRVILKGSYRIHDEIIRAFTSLPGGTNNYYVFMYEPLTAKNWSMELKTVLVERPSANWTLTAMVFHDKYERKKYGNGQFVSTPTEALYLDAGQAPLRSGLRTSVTLRRFYLQAAALVNLNEQIMDKAGTVHNDRTTYRTNFLLAGYTWPLLGRVVKEIEANLQSQNLLGSDVFPMSKYVGVGVHVRF